MHQAARFLQAAGAHPRYSRQLLLAYIDLLVQHGYGAQTVHVYVAALRALFRANGLEWPLVPRDLHLGLPESEAGGPVLAYKEIAALVAEARRDGGREGAMIALSTVYGLRSTEIAAVMSGGCDGQVLALQAAKGNRLREHRIPAGLTGTLSFPPRAVGRDGVHKAFQRAMLAYARPPKTGEGWHAIRRALVTGLVDAGLDRYVLSKWMGWRVSETAYRYFRPSPAELDRQVYGVHPFLPLWLEER